MEKIESKTGWGKREIYEAFQLSVVETWRDFALQIIDSMTVSGVIREKPISEWEKEYE